MTTALIYEELARGDLGLAVSHMCTSWAWKPAFTVAKRCPKKVRPIFDAFAKVFTEDKVGVACFAMTEPGGSHGGGGCDIESYKYKGTKLKTIFRTEGDKCIINGTKLWATNSGIADLYCVLGTVDPSLGEAGLMLAYIPKDWPGLTLGPDEDKCGCRSDHNCPIYLDDVKIPREWTIGPGEEAIPAFWNQLPGVSSGAFATGIMQAVLEILLEYTGERIVGDRPIRQHGGPAEIIAEIAMRTEMARTWYLVTGYMCDHPETYGDRLETPYLRSRMNMARIQGENAVWYAEQAIRLMGNYGYVRENHVEKYWRDALELTLWKGGTHMSL